MYSLTVTIHYPDDFKEYEASPSRMSRHRVVEEIMQLLMRERNAISFTFTTRPLDASMPSKAMDAYATLSPRLSDEQYDHNLERHEGWAKGD